MDARKSHVDRDQEDNSKKRTTNLPSDKHFLDTFWKLAVPVDNERISGAKTLLDILVTKQNETSQGENCSEVDYSLRRLVRGLASSRKGARQGYAIALTELLARVREVSLDSVFKRVKQELQVSGKKSEEKEYAFGQVFAYIAVIQSGRLDEHNGASAVHVLQQLHALARQKSYLQLVCLQATIDLINRSSVEVFTEHLWPVLKPELKQGWGEEASPNTLALLITCRQKFPNIVKAKFLQNHYGHADLVHPSNFPHIVNVLTKSTIISHPNVHPVCDMLLALLFEDSSKVSQFWKIVVDDGLCTAKHETKYLAFALLERAVPRCESKQLRALFSEKLVRSMINNLANRQAILHSAAVKLSENLALAVKSVSDPQVQFGVTKCLLSRPGHVKFDDITKSKTVSGIISSFNVGAVKLYLKWLKKLFSTGTAAISHRIQEPNLDADRQWICMQVLTLIRNPSLPREDGWLLDATRFLFLHAFFTVDRPELAIPECSRVLETPVSEELRKTIATQFYGALGVLSAASLRPPVEGQDAAEDRSTSPESRQMGTMSNGELWVSVLGHYAQNLLSSPNITCSAGLSEKARAAWSLMMSSVGKIQEKSSQQSAVSSGLAFQLLFLHVGLQLFSDPEQSADILQDLQTCYERARQRRRSKKDKEDEPDWVEVIVEILLSLLSRHSHLLRTVVDLAFKTVCPHMTRPALQMLLDVLDPEKSSVRVGQESDEEDEEDEDLEEVEEEEEEEEGGDEKDFTVLKSKKQLANGHKKGEEEVESDDSEDEDDEDEEDEEEDDDEEDDDDDGEEDAALKHHIKAALGDAAVDSGAEDSGTDFELDDEAMLRRDAALSQAFKAMAARSRRNKKEASTLMLHFKLRVLDLLDIFIKRQQTNPLLLDLVLPLLKVIESSAGHRDSQLLAEKALNIYKNKLCRVKKYPHNLSDHRDAIHDTIQELVQIAKNAHSLTIVSLVSSGCLFLMRVLRGNAASTDPSPLKTRGQRTKEAQSSKQQKKKKGKKGEKKSEGAEEDEEEEEEGEACMGLLDVGRVTGLYADALQDFTMHRATCLHPNLFTDLIDRFPLLAWNLTDALTKAIQSGVQVYRRTQACRMLSLLLSKRPYTGKLSSWPGVSKRILTVVARLLQGMLGGEDGAQLRAKSGVQLLHTVQQCARLGHELHKAPDFKEISAVLESLKDRPEVKRSGELRSAVDTALSAISNKSGKAAKKGKKKRRKSRKRRRSISTSSV